MTEVSLIMRGILSARVFRGQGPDLKQDAMRRYDSPLDDWEFRDDVAQT
jgi:hypothetical protein